MPLLLICVKIDIRFVPVEQKLYRNVVYPVSLPYVVSRAGTPGKRAVSGWLGAAYGINKPVLLFELARPNLFT